MKWEVLIPVAGILSMPLIMWAIYSGEPKLEQREMISCERLCGVGEVARVTALECVCREKR